MHTRANVLLIHGLWMGPGIMRFLGERLSAARFEPHFFAYSSIKQGSELGLEALREHIARLDTPHLVGHSLGGLMAMALLESAHEVSVGRTVCLGSPLCGSAAARGIGKLPGGMRMLGKSRQILEQGFSKATHRHQVGMIAGSKPIGLGCVVGRIARPHDGSVGLSETQLPGLTDHITIHASHTGMNFSPQAAQLVIEFLRHGRFQPQEANSLIS
jgi:pimeloyl-ACP methyl ester carboxylesterase